MSMDKKVQTCEETLEEVGKMLSEIADDSTVPKNVKVRLATALDTLRNQKDASIKVHKALNELGEIADDANIQPYTRTQVWNVVSILEKL